MRPAVKFYCVEIECTLGITYQKLILFYYMVFRIITKHNIYNLDNYVLTYPMPPWRSRVGLTRIDVIWFIGLVWWWRYRFAIWFTAAIIRLTFTACSTFVFIIIIFLFLQNSKSKEPCTSYDKSARVHR